MLGCPAFPGPERPEQGTEFSAADCWAATCGRHSSHAPFYGRPVQHTSMRVQCNTPRRESWLRPPPQPQNWHLPMSIAKVTIRADPGSVLKTRSESGQQVAYGHRISRRQAGPSGGEEAAYGSSSHRGLVARASPSENTKTPCDGARRPGYGGGAEGKPEHKKHGRCSQHRPCQSHRKPAPTRWFSAEDHVTDPVRECNSRCPPPGDLPQPGPPGWRHQ